MNFLLAALTSFSVGFLLTPIIVSVLKKAKIGDSPGGRKIHKKFTPSMGGIAFMSATYVALAIWGWQFPLPDIRFLLGAIALMFFVGFRDDMVELKAKHKILGQLVAVVLVIVAGDIRIKEFHGFLGIDQLPLLVSYSFSAFVLLALTNAFNLIDGLDGLAAGTTAIIAATLALFAYVSGNTVMADYLNIFYIPYSGELVIFAGCFLGACIGFLWYNAYPAKVFMGDTGSLTIGGIVAAMAIILRKELLIPVLCGIYLIENLSVIVQVFYFKYTRKKYGEGRRIFLMAPLHHHYQKKGIHEAKIVTRFWIIGILLAIISFITLKIR